MLSKLRTSNHNLEIERGRHKGLGLQVKEWICELHECWSISKIMIIITLKI